MFLFYSRFLELQSQVRSGSIWVYVSLCLDYRTRGCFLLSSNSVLIIYLFTLSLKCPPYYSQAPNEAPLCIEMFSIGRLSLIVFRVPNILTHWHVVLPTKLVRYTSFSALSFSHAISSPRQAGNLPRIQLILVSMFAVGCMLNVDIFGANSHSDHRADEFGIKTLFFDSLTLSMPSLFFKFVCFAYRFDQRDAEIGAAG